LGVGFIARNSNHSNAERNSYHSNAEHKKNDIMHAYMDEYTHGKTYTHKTHTKQPQAPPAPDIRGVGISFDQERDRHGMMRVYVRRIRPGSSAAEVLYMCNTFQGHAAAEGFSPTSPRAHWIGPEA